MSRFVSVALVGGLVLVSCASELKQRPASLDPSNPDAPESPVLPVSAALAPEPSQKPREEPSAGSAPDHSAHQSGHGRATSGSPDGGTTIFTCPMHPEVKQPGPGRCPKCGMNLVPQEGTGPSAPTPKERSEPSGSKQDPPKQREESTTYTCPMHPEVSAAKPGRCPKCGMDLVPRKPAKQSKPKSHEPKPQGHEEQHHGEHGGHP